MLFSVLVETRLRPGIADPQGATIERSLPALGFDGIRGVRVGKAIRFELEAPDEDERPGARRRGVPAVPHQPGDRGRRHHDPGRRARLMAALVGVVTFPGSNCELDAVEAIEALGGRAELLWHADATVGQADAVILPGGFAHGDYLRPGAIARFSPIMDAVREHAAAGGPVVGICNGFQVLTEAGLLPGALQKNRGLKFLCTTTRLRVETTDSALTAEAEVGDVLQIPINHFEGNYTCDAETLAELRAEDRVVVRYVDNPNGSVDDIAGVCNEGSQRRRPHAAPRAGVPLRCWAPPTAPCCCGRCS